MNAKRLFIIGNGFDLDHGRKTSYLDFRNYVNSLPSGEQFVRQFEKIGTNAIRYLQKLDTYNERKRYDSNIPKPASNWTDTDIRTVYQSNPLWNNTELTLKNIFNPGFVDMASAFCPAHNINVDRVKQEFLFCGQFSNFLEQWVDFVNSESVDRKYDFPINSDDIFISFNYTDTLEKIYNVPEAQIFHVHGQRGTKPTSLIIGHDEENHTQPTRANCEASCRLHKTAIFDADKAVTKPIDVTADKIVQNLPDIESDTLKEIYILGHSMSEIDKIYFEEIVQLTQASKPNFFVSIHKTENRDSKLKLCKVPGILAPTFLEMEFLMRLIKTPSALLS